ncbi:histidine ammonia-lyase isoform X2 [Archocentrus centrarchus]|uniref:histidine ammonia-lyase isoform X2 n=1 Tax=Archocentrus centrarchus TaxID=63155 RepID=UPI0011E9CBDE|nr:histidine ammonia-lyase isoform X2 [Archocentrus centrarchus]
MPRFTVHIRDEWLALPCRDTSNTIQWLGQEALKRYMKNKPDNGGITAVKDTRFVVRRCQGLGLLDMDDTVEDVLEDNDFVELAIEGDTMSPEFIPCEPGVSPLTAAYKEPEEYISLDGNSLTSTDLVNLGRGLYKIKLTPEAERKVVQSRELLDTIVKENKVVYGITTGFGKFARTVIPVSKLKELQENLVRSHSAGVGNPLSPERTRMLLALRINVLAKGHSGISLETLQAMIQAFNASCLSFVPQKGTVGASGDLAPLSHLALGLMGEGKMWSPKSGWADAKYVLEAHGLKPISLKPKESHRFCDRVQDAYTMRCCPQVHGVANDTIAFVQNIINTEINSATDNPMVFAERGETISGGNFHGEYPAKALDFLAIAVHELASISERRIERLCNPSLSELPAFLVNEGGLNSGFMIAHCTAAALVSENKVLCHPSSVDSLSTSAATEDHVSMGGWAARKALRVIEHVEQVLAIELLAACQGIEFLRPLRTTTPLEKVYELVRSVVKPWIKDRFMSPDIEAVHRLLLDQKVWNVAKPYIDKYQTEYIPESRPVSPTAFSLESPASPRKRVRHE